ncbi:hypothetical protein NE237_033282 [Protea cynaroides]|uniref:RBR-type E3 ubiquitin transferase n=1 Tax=Protea cynaroides TaxID=273540 RepID=A0A9Q0L5D6_9MAGN|nr:hypothetical protein NE237_033282 [Protea cynaroides]
MYSSAREAPSGGQTARNQMYSTSSADSSMEEEVPSLICDICMEPIKKNNKFNNKNRCAHPFCLDCIIKYIGAKMRQNTAEVSCPASNCDKLLDPLSCRSILPAGLFERWCDVLSNSAVSRCESAYCPVAKCSTLVLNECGGKITRTECPNCRKFFCFQCKIPWHVGFSCNGTQQLRDENDILFEKLVDRNKWMRCPCCNFRVEKIEGCSNITCRCGVLFCYACGKIKNACECNLQNVPREGGHIRARTYIANGRSGFMNSWIFNFIYKLLINLIFIGLIVGLYKIKENKVANVIGTILMYLYYIYVFPSTGRESYCRRRRSFGGTIKFFAHFSYF